MIRTWAMLVPVVVWPHMALALDLPSGAVQTGSAADGQGLWSVPVGPATRDAPPPVETLEGGQQRHAWRVPAQGLAMVDLLAALRDTLGHDGFHPIHHCADRDCGGFDFRAALPVLPLPAMYVDLGAFLSLSLRAPATADRPAALVHLLVSRSARDALTVHMTRITQTPRQAPAMVPVEVAPTPSEQPDLAERLGRDGHVTLEGVAFETGSATLAAVPGDTLARIADLLEEGPDLRLTLVGHTDATGSLAGNMALSTARAEAVRDRLIERYAVDPGRLSAQGVGPLAPRAGNATPEERARNRRVDLVWLDGALPDTP